MQTLVVIGGSKGIGKSIIEQHINDHKVVNISRTEPEISHPNLTHYQSDILIDELPELEQVDKLVYCPGSINLKPFKRLKVEDFQSDFEVNVLGAVKAIQKYEAPLKASSNASIVLFSTVASKLGMPFHASIAVSKSGIEGLTKSLGAEFAPTVRINAIAPTVTDTGLASKLLRNEKMIENMSERHPLKKFLKPKEVADMATFLLSDKAASTSGQVFELDCGIVSFKI